MASVHETGRPDTARRLRGTGHGWSHFFMHRTETVASFDSLCIVDPDFDEDANDDPLTGEPLDQSVYNTGRPFHYAIA